jgi:small subunit ribosomal protein S1
MSSTTTLTPPADLPNAKIVENSDGLLLEIDGRIVPNYDATIHPFTEGDVVTGHVVRIDNDEVLVDIGYKSEGVIPSGELSIRKSVDPADEVQLGEEVDALVLTKEDQDGRLILSKKRARFEKAWRRIEAAAESGEPVEGAVIEVVKGGLIIDLGVRGFLPASLVDIRRVPNLDEYMGTMIECKVIELNRSRNNVVLSRRAVLEEQRKEDRERILDRLQPAQVVEGTISNIVDFGAFVDLDGIDGLIHISELSWSHVNHPSEILSIGDTVSVKVLDIDRQRQRISLGLKQTQEDPWQRVVDTYNIGDELEGTVTKVVTFGAFVEILDGVEGLVHISELAQHHVENPREIIQPGDPVRVKILEIDSERRRLSLSIKRVEGQVLPVRPIEPPLESDAGSLDDVPELGLSEEVFSGEIATADVVLDDDVPEPEAADPEPALAEAAEPEAAVAEAGVAEPEAPEPAAPEPEPAVAEAAVAEPAVAEPEVAEPEDTTPDDVPPAPTEDSLNGASTDADAEQPQPDAPSA